MSFKMIARGIRKVASLNPHLRDELRPLYAMMKWASYKKDFMESSIFDAALKMRGGNRRRVRAHLDILFELYEEEFGAAACEKIYRKIDRMVGL